MTHPLSLSSDPRRWVARRKADILEAIRKGDVSVADACRRHDLSVDELFSWQAAYRSHGLDGLRAMRLKTFRQST
jgi:transposase-like protein